MRRARAVSPGFPVAKPGIRGWDFHFTLSRPAWGAAGPGNPGTPARTLTVAYGELPAPVAELRSLSAAPGHHPIAVRPEAVRALELAERLGGMTRLPGPTTPAGPPATPWVPERLSPTYTVADDPVGDADVGRLVWIVSMVLDPAEAAGDERCVRITEDQADDLRQLPARPG